MSYKTEAIILSSRDVNEFDRIYDIFSADFGKTSILAKGVRKPIAKLASGLEPITYSEIFLTKGRSLDRVTGVIIHDQYNKIKKDLDKIKFIKPIFLIFRNSFLEINNSQKDIFNLIIRFLEESAEGEVDCEKMRLMRISLILKIICLLGNQPELFYCSDCQKKFSLQDQNFWFCSSLELYCNSCGANSNLKKIKVNQSIIKILRLIVQKEWNILQKILVKEKELNQLEKVIQLSLENILSSKIFF